MKIRDYIDKHRSAILFFLIIGVLIGGMTFISVHYFYIAVDTVLLGELGASEEQAQTFVDSFYGVVVISMVMGIFLGTIIKHDENTYIN